MLTKKTLKTEMIPQESIASKILLIKGQRVILDRDLAELYGVPTKALNQAVKRNLKRFPHDFMLHLTTEEANSLRSQVVTLKRGEHRKYLPSAFTEQGVAMLSSVLNSEKAIAVNIQIMRTFTRLREIVAANKDIRDLLKKHSEALKKHDTEIKYIFEAIEQLLSPVQTNAIGFIG